MHIKKKLGEILVEGGWVSRQDLEAALREKGPGGKRIGRVLLEKNLISERTLLEAVSRQTGVGIAELSEELEDPEVVSLLPYAVAKQYRALPLRKNGRVLEVAMTDPQDADAIQGLQFATGMRVQATLCSEREIDIAIEHRYGMEEAMERIVRNVTEQAQLDGLDTAWLQEGQGGVGGSEAPAGAREGPRAPAAPIVRFVNLILLEAVRKEASDVHFEPSRQSLQVRFRQDGVLRRRMVIPKSLQLPVLSRLKVMARMDIANKRTPQDGGIRIEADRRRLDLRVSSLPGFFGEKIVIRILDQTGEKADLPALGMRDEDLQRLASCYRRPQGMLLVTGPTGSGKSTTLRCVVKELCSEGINIVTLEDPMEYEMEGINQVQVHPEAGLSFAGTLRAILRQDPDVIMVGEIRDSETAEVAFRAALTGHLVLSTLHTNDTVSTITRLVDMGVPRFLIASALLAVLSQRLVRRVCPSCGEEEQIEPARLAALEAATARSMHPRRGKGCSHCDYSGFKGRIGLFELLLLTPETREAIARGATEGELKRLGMAQGMRPLARDGLIKIGEGLIDFREIGGVVCWEEGDLGQSAPPPGALSPNREAALGTGSAGWRILVAEDNPGVREAVCLTLQALSGDVVAAADGLEAWEMVERHPPDLIISDIHMPRLDGYGLLKRVRSDLRSAFVPVILLTARNRCEDRMQGYLLGGDDYIEKPFDHRELLVRARRCLERGFQHAAPSRPGAGQSGPSCSSPG